MDTVLDVPWTCPLTNRRCHDEVTPPVLHLLTTCCLDFPDSFHQMFGTDALRQNCIDDNSTTDRDTDVARRLSDLPEQGAQQWFSDHLFRFQVFRVHTWTLSEWTLSVAGPRSMGHVVPSISKLSARDGQTLRCHPREHVTVCYVSATCQIRLDPRWRPLCKLLNPTPHIQKCDTKT